MIDRYLNDLLLTFALERLRDAKWDPDHRVDFMMATNGKQDLIDSLEVITLKDEAQPNHIAINGIQVPLIGKEANF